MELNALNNQIGGNHYKSMNMQPIELISKLKLNYFQGNIVKYISRNKDNKIEDLEKAKHYCELAIDLDKINLKFKLRIIFFKYKKPINEIINYRRINLMDKHTSNIIFSIYFKEYKEAIKEIDKVFSLEIEKQLNKEINKIPTKGIPEELKRKISLITKDYLDKENSLKKEPIIFTNVTREELDGKRLICYNYAKE